MKGCQGFCKLEYMWKNNGAWKKVSFFISKLENDIISHVLPKVLYVVEEMWVLTSQLQTVF